MSHLSAVSSLTGNGAKKKNPNLNLLIEFKQHSAHHTQS